MANVRVVIAINNLKDEDVVSLKEEIAQDVVEHNTTHGVIADYPYLTHEDVSITVEDVAIAV